MCTLTGKVGSFGQIPVASRDQGLILDSLSFKSFGFIARLLKQLGYHLLDDRENPLYADRKHGWLYIYGDKEPLIGITCDTLKLSNTSSVDVVVLQYPSMARKPHLVYVKSQSVVLQPFSIPGHEISLVEKGRKVASYPHRTLYLPSDLQRVEYHD
jgi:hypothetical protein